MHLSAAFGHVREEYPADDPVLNGPEEWSIPYMPRSVKFVSRLLHAIVALMLQDVPALSFPCRLARDGEEFMRDQHIAGITAGPAGALGRAEAADRTGDALRVP